MGSADAIQGYQAAPEEPKLVDSKQPGGPLTAGAPEEFIDWQGHDLSMRGMSGVHDAMRCGTGHLLSVTGTDTIPAIDYAEDFYGADADKELVGGSIPATEHSVMTLRILLTLQRLARYPANAILDEKALRRLAEREVIRELVTQDYPAGMVSIVSDSFDFWNVMTVFAKDLKEEIRAQAKCAGYAQGRVPSRLGRPGQDSHGLP